MPTQPWSTVAQQWTPQGVYSRNSRDGIQVLLGTEDSAQCDQLVQTIGIDLMTSFYEQKLAERFTAEYPDTLDGMKQEYTRRLQMAEEFQNYSAQVARVNEAVSQVSVGGVVVGTFPLGTSIFVPSNGVYGLVLNLKPGYWFIDSSVKPINTSLLANETNPGDYLADINPQVAVSVYINRGTRAAPNWVAADSQALVDLIYNPTRILECGYQRIMANIELYAKNVPTGVSLEWRHEYMPKSVKLRLETTTEYEDMSFGLLRVDRSANGVISDYDKDANKITKWFV